MLNNKNERELVYVTLIDNIEPIIGSDNCECAIVGGWHVMVRKGQFNVGDPAIYFEIDSKVPSANSAFAFLEKRNYKVKTQKFTFGGKGNFISQGLLMHPNDFGWATGWDHDDTSGDVLFIVDNNGERHYSNDESRFLTSILGVTYADDEDNARKAPSVDKYKKMTQRHPNIFKKPWARWMMKREWGRKLMFLFFGKKKDKKNGWPAWVSKTDEERVQNMPWILNDTGSWVITEKIDGSSTTFTMKRGKRGKNEFYVCSRNVCFDSVDKPCYYDTNIYWEMAQKYDMYNVLSKFLENHPDEEWVTIQGETFGNGVQKRDYSMDGHDFRAFNLITSNTGRYGTLEMENTLKHYNVPCVPIIHSDFHFDFLDQVKLDGENNRVDTLLNMATGKSEIDMLPREGYVLRSADGTKSFKAVSNSFLLKYHG